MEKTGIKKNCHISLTLKLIPPVFIPHLLKVDLPSEQNRSVMLFVLNGDV